ncbi:hypothetical protein, unknown function [Leishmania tarentolae]|uniref:Uncharacterized protein n=1 Tax=Leishmania tarentolae TaxID=5689 RepID=A0A640KGW7_LEITA|nr:hypothetical protein, unknown function [Leishmania tarentolae]
MSQFEKKDIISTPVPFPRLPIPVVPRSERSWVQNNWWVLLTGECLVVFAAFVALLVYYLRNVLTPGKRLVDDKVDNDGLSHHRSDLSSPSRSIELEESSGPCRYSTTTKRSLAGNAARDTVDGGK